MDRTDLKMTKLIPSTSLRRLIYLLCLVSAVLALAFAVLCILLYSLRWDRFAAFTFIPAWIWLSIGLTSAILIGFFHRAVALAVLSLWAVFTFLYVEEASSLTRAAVDNFATPAVDASVRKLTVVSLNCLGGQIASAKETALYNPDIVLLQETPSVLVDLQKLADEIFANQGHVLLGADTTILSRFPIEKIPVNNSTNWVHARIKLPSGTYARVISLRLKPPVIDTDLLSAECWRVHFEDRVQRRQSIQAIRDQLEEVPLDEPLIVGGDFNVPANDGCLSPLRNRMIDVFSIAGRGWGNTVLNDVPLFRIDQIWTSNGFGCDSVRAFRSENSDHRLVVCNLRY